MRASYRRGPTTTGRRRPETPRRRAYVSQTVAKFPGHGRCGPAAKDVRCAVREVALAMGMAGSATTGAYARGVPTADLSFELLIPFGSAQSCLAYWIGPCDVAALRGINAIDITRAMAYQYDVEEQADRTGVVVTEDADWRAWFMPVAPVQLTRVWSPLPYAIELLGAPDWISTERDPLGTVAVACAWAGARADELTATWDRRPDRERFRRLLAVALMRAHNHVRGVMIAAKPGWSYGSAQSTSTETQRLMASTGFVVQDRHA
jgi:hypothetical protein